MSSADLFHVRKCKTHITIISLLQEAFSNRAVQLSANELDRMKEERKQLNDELRAENEALEKVKADRRNLESELLQMKLNRDTSNRKLRSVFVVILFFFS